MPVIDGNHMIEVFINSITVGEGSVQSTKSIAIAIKWRTIDNVRFQQQKNSSQVTKIKWIQKNELTNKNKIMILRIPEGKETLNPNTR